MARDIPAGTDTTATVEAEDFVRGVLERRGDHDWYRVELDPGRYVFRLSGARRRSGRRPAAHPARRERRRDRPERQRLPRHRQVAHRVRGHRRPQDLLSRRQRQRPLHGPSATRRQPGRKVGHATGDFALGVNRLDGSPVDAIAGAQWLEERVVDVFFVPAGRNRRDLRRRPHRSQSAGWNDYQIRTGDGGARRLLGRLRRQLPPDRSQRAAGRLRAPAPTTSADRTTAALFQPPGTIGEGTGVFAAARTGDFAHLGEPAGRSARTPGATAGS